MDKSVYGKIISLTKQIFLIEPKNEETFFRRFLTGGKYLGSGTGLEWWFTRKSHNILNDISNMIIEQQELAEKKEHLTALIEQVLQENALNKELFKEDDIFFRKVNSLFDARVIEDPIEFAKRIWTLISSFLNQSIQKSLVVYPLHRVKTINVSLGYSGLYLLSSHDFSAWQNFSASYKEAQYWNPQTGKLANRDSMLSFGSPSSWLICEVNGTTQGARRLAGRNMRIFISILFALLRGKYSTLLDKSMAMEYKNSFQFSNKGTVCASIGALLPPLLVDIEISNETITMIREWYKECGNNRRAITAAHFMNYGIMADGLERFIHFFIGLDALFGERDKVEATIFEGIKRTFSQDIIWEEKASNLFDLRCELVHGGIFEIDEWNRLEHYLKYFKTHPLQDIELASLEALKCYAKHIVTVSAAERGV